MHAVNQAGSGPHSDRVQWHAADLRLPEASLKLVREVRPTHLLHSAWTATPGRFWTDPDNFAWLAAGLALLQGFGEAGGTRFVGVGTCAEYDWQQTSFAEDNTVIRPSTLYGKAKAAMWAAAEAASEVYGFSAAWGRVFLPFGPGDASQRLIPSVVNSLLARRPVQLSEGRQERDFIFAPDVADLLLRLLAGSEAGAFNVATGRATQVRTVVERLGQRLGAPELLMFGSLPTRTDEPDRLVADMTKVSGMLGWIAPTSLEAGLDEVLDRLAKPVGPAFPETVS